MKTVPIIPGLVVDEGLFYAAVDGLAAQAPAEQLTWDGFTNEDRWILVPDHEGFGYKAEFLLRREADATIKINLWMAPDLRSDSKPMPHGHPWPFTAHILTGGYSEQRYEIHDGAVHTQTRVQRTGATNHLPLTAFHEITEIHEPGRTLTLMICGAGAREEWGYLDPETGQFTPRWHDPSFQERVKSLNPRMH